MVVVIGCCYDCRLLLVVVGSLRITTSSSCAIGTLVLLYDFKRELQQVRLGVEYV